MTRDEHLAECKRRALEYLDAGDPREAFTSMLSDIGKHPGNSKPRRYQDWRRVHAFPRMD